MKPALSRFLNTIKEKLKNTFITQLTAEEQQFSTLIDLKNLAQTFIANENVDDELATEFIQNFYKIKQAWQATDKKSLTHENIEKITALIELLEDNEIFILNLLLHSDKGNQELKTSSFTNHFYKFLKCPFQVKLENEKIEFVLFYDREETESGQKQRKEGARFYNALLTLGIVNSHAKQESQNKCTMTIPAEHLKDMLQLAQFDLIDEKNAPKKIEDLTEKFRRILMELIDTESSFSAQAGKLATLLKIKLTDKSSKISQEERQLLQQALTYYQEIANDPLPWFGNEVTVNSLNGKSFDDLMQNTHYLYSRLQNDSKKAAEIGKRLGILRWVSVNYSKLNELINGKENKLGLTNKSLLLGNGRKESEKDIANQYLIPPVQRMPRIVLLTGELIKCAELIIKNTQTAKTGYLNELRSLNELWIKIAKETNEFVNEIEDNNKDKKDDSTVKGIFEIFNSIELKEEKPVNLSATVLADDIIGDFSSLMVHMKLESSDKLAGLDEEIPINFMAENSPASNDEKDLINSDILYKNDGESKESVIWESKIFSSDQEKDQLENLQNGLWRSIIFEGEQSHTVAESPLAHFYDAVKEKIATKMENLLDALKAQQIELTTPKKIKFQQTLEDFKECLSFTYETFVRQPSNDENALKQLLCEKITATKQDFSAANIHDNKIKNDITNFLEQEIFAMEYLLDESFEPKEFSFENILDLKGRFANIMKCEFFNLALGKANQITFSFDLLKEFQKAQKMLAIFSIPFLTYDTNGKKDISINAENIQAVLQLTHFINANSWSELEQKNEMAPAEVEEQAIKPNDQEPHQNEEYQAIPNSASTIFISGPSSANTSSASIFNLPPANKNEINMDGKNSIDDDKKAAEEQKLAKKKKIENERRVAEEKRVAEKERREAEEREQKRIEEEKKAAEEQQKPDEETENLTKKENVFKAQEPLENLSLLSVQTHTDLNTGELPKINATTKKENSNFARTAGILALIGGVVAIIAGVLLLVLQPELAPIALLLIKIGGCLAIPGGVLLAIDALSKHKLPDDHIPDVPNSDSSNFHDSLEVPGSPVNPRKNFEPPLPSCSTKNEKKEPLVNTPPSDKTNTPS